MHLQIEEAIGEQYMPQIDAIIARAQYSPARPDGSSASRRSRDVLAANLEAQQLTIRAAAIYRQYLRDQAGQVNKPTGAREGYCRSLEHLRDRPGLRRAGEPGAVQPTVLEGLMNRQVPALRPFENLEMQREFQKLTEQLREANPSWEDCQ